MEIFNNQKVNAFYQFKEEKKGNECWMQQYFLVDSDQYSSITGNAKEVRSG